MAGRARRLYGGRTGRGNGPRPAGRLSAVRAPPPDRGVVGPAQRRAPWPWRSSSATACWPPGAAANFERIYDLTERVIPAAVLALPTPAREDAQRELMALAARCMGVATVADLADYFWMRVPAARPRVAELVEDGRLTEVSVEGWRSPPICLPGVRPTALRRRDATLISPFDSLIWARARTQRLFGIPLPN